MKKTALTALALCVCLLGGTVATSSAGTAKQTKTKVMLSFTKGNPPYSESAFTGSVKGKKVCRSKRKVKIKAVGKKVPGLGKAKTDKKGAFSIAASSSIPKGQYVAKVKKKKVKKGGATVVCGKGKSAKVTVS